MSTVAPYDRFNTYIVIYHSIGELTVYPFANSWNWDEQLGKVYWNSDSPDWGYNSVRAEDYSTLSKDKHFDSMEDAINHIISFERVPNENRFDKDNNALVAKGN